MATRWLSEREMRAWRAASNWRFAWRDGVVSYTFFLEDDPRLRATYMERTRAYIAMYEEMIGPYPYEKLAQVQSTPGSLEEALQALADDHEFLLKGDVFTKDVIETWLEYKRVHEVDAIRLRPHPYEFALYFDI